MTESNEATLFVRLSINVYRFLLLAYPSTYRQEYGPHMAQVFRDLCLRTYTNAGLIGMLHLWGRTLIDFFSSVIEQHLQRGTFMSKQKFLRLSGLMLVLAGLHKIFAFLPDLSFRHTSQVGMDFLFPNLPLYTPLATVFILIGMVVLLFRYFEQSGVFQRLCLALSVVGASISLLVVLIQFLPFLLPVVERREDYYQVLFESDFYPYIFKAGIYAVLVIYLGLIGFGIVSAVKQTMPILKVLPFFGGTPYLIFFLLPITHLLRLDAYTIIGTVVSQVIPGLGWVALGLMLISIPITSQAISSRASLTGATR